ncbi:hypothetical protein [Cellulomonas chengniuliangii]|uniref:hypothetical protein n=1 Tax=Cellulomonas chengniuliangii TaxID=2968084 RepID=UPI001D0E0035|nr:hypothetical protein [Cellulomonas chengniuliangii]MCC2318025.1 hypothetical protein [Cellulomonas chengniuliangii]
MRDDVRVPDYLARITVQDVPDEAVRAGMADALGATGDDHPEPLPPTGMTVAFEVPGEAPDLATALDAAHRHAAEVLDGFVWEVEVDPR